MQMGLKCTHVFLYTNITACMFHNRLLVVHSTHKQTENLMAKLKQTKLKKRMLFNKTREYNIQILNTFFFSSIDQDRSKVQK